MKQNLWARFAVSLVLAVLVMGGFSLPLGLLPPLGSLLDPTSGVWTIAPGSRYPASTEVRVPGLSGPVTVLRDEHGVPHISASNARDGWFALGYVCAQDRLFQMDIQYRLAAGRLSEVTGPSMLESDRFYRTIGLHRIAAGAVATTPPPGDLVAEASDAYVDGVNAFIASIPVADLPLEFKLLDYRPEPWSAEKLITVGLLTTWLLAGDFSDLHYALLVDKLGPAVAEELFPPYPASLQYPIEGGPGVRSASAGVRISERAARDILHKAAAAEAILPRPEGIGSNNWAVSGSRTATGMPLLAADPHLPFTLPAVWYEAELHAPPYHARGATFPGIPGFFFGTNGHIAWGETNTGADVNDFYVETFRANGTEYLFRGEWRNATVHGEAIRVRGGTTETLSVLETVHGPVLTQLDQTVAWKSTITESRDEVRAMLLINRAQNWTEFREALRYWRVPAQNFIYADANGPQGNIGIRSNGLYPIRNGSILPREPLDGASGEYEWTGFVPFDDYPEAFNPPEGFVTSSNNVPVRPSYPYYLGTFWDYGYRSRRIHEILEADASMTLDELRASQLDVRDTAAAAFIPELLRAVVARDESDQQILDALAAWDFRAVLDSIGPTFWTEFLGELSEQTFGDEYEAAGATDLVHPLTNTLEAMLAKNPEPSWFDDVRTTAVRETRDGILQMSFEAVVDRLTSELGTDRTRWEWGLRHTRTFPHLTQISALSRGPYPSVGDGYTLNVASGLESTWGPSWRQLLDFSDLNHSLVVYPGGQSGNPVSAHFDDLLGLYRSGEYTPFRGHWSVGDFAPGEIESTLRLLPR